MLRKLAKSLTNNFGLKILALAFAIVLWLIVVNVEDPVRSKSIKIPVTIENESYLTDMGKTYDILKNEEISFTVSAKRSITEELSESDFTATANMENINEQMTQVPITISASRYPNQIEINRRTNGSYLQIQVENLITKKYNIEPMLEGEPVPGCHVDHTEVKPRRVTVTGPESVVNTIRSARVNVNVDGAEENVVTNGEIVLLDDGEEPVSKDRLSLNRKKAAVDVIILMEKEVPLEIRTTGTPPDGYRLETVSGSLEKVRLTGPPEILDPLDALEISAPQLNLTGRTANFTATLGLTYFLPDEVTLAQGEPSTVEVAVEIAGQQVRRFDVPSGNITVQNLDPGLELQFDRDSVPVLLRGFAEDLDQIDAGALSGTLDAAGLTEGQHSVPVALTGAYEQAAETRIQVTVTDRAGGQDGAAGRAEGNP